MNKRIYIALAVVAIFILSGCKKNGANFSSSTKLEVVEPQFEYLSAKAKVKLDMGKRGITSSTNFRIRKDSVIWASITPAFGIEAARVLITQKRIQVLDRINKKSFDYTFEELSNQLDVKLDYKIMQSVLLGNLIIPYENQKIIKDEKYYHYEVDQGKYKIQNYIGVLSKKLEKLNINQATSTNEIKVNYLDFRNLEDGQIFPFTINALMNNQTQGNTQNAAIINYHKIQIEKKPLRFPFSIPSRYERRKNR